jgi:hypothetical protein
VLLWARAADADGVVTATRAATAGWAQVRRVAFEPAGAVATLLA